MKAFTDIEQSRKLAEILPIESADMWYQHTGYSIVDGTEKSKYFPMVIRDWKSDDDIPCWSCAALLDILPKGYSLGNKKSNNKYNICMTFVEHDVIEYDNPVDVCYEMILELHEKGLL